MSIVSPFHDACVAGCLANASLTGSAKKEAPAPRQDAAFAPSSLCETPVQAATRTTGRRRLFEAVFSLISGPTMPRGV
jgi:hypothetical protein